MGSAKRHIAGVYVSVPYLAIESIYIYIYLHRITSCLTGRRRSVMTARGGVVAKLAACYLSDWEGKASIKNCGERSRA